eukprot:Gb_24657 [translate_table: standard]
MECYDEGDEDPSICMHKKGYLGFGSNLVQMPAWFDLRVFYVRVCSCPVDDGSSAPQYLTLRHIPKNADIALEVNGGRIVPSEGVSLVLRRDRVDKESEEATFVSTDNVRTTGTLQFEVYDQDDLLLCGTLELLEGSNNDQGLEKVNPLSKNQRKGWSMDCCSAVGPAGCGLLRGRNIPGAAISPPTVEVYVAGCFSGFPVILTKTVQLICRRKISRWTTMDAIPENKTIDRNQNSIVQTDEVWSETLIWPCLPNRMTYCSGFDFDLAPVKFKNLFVATGIVKICICKKYRVTCAVSIFWDFHLPSCHTHCALDQSIVWLLFHPPATFCHASSTVPPACTARVHCLPSKPPRICHQGIPQVDFWLGVSSGPRDFLLADIFPCLRRYSHRMDCFISGLPENNLQVSSAYHKLLKTKFSKKFAQADLNISLVAQSRFFHLMAHYTSISCTFHIRNDSFHAISQYNPCSTYIVPSPPLPKYNKLSQDRDYEELDEMDGHNLNNFYPRGGYIEGDDGELSWFNAGVRVGVGIGLGMCLGIGIGVGLFVRTYQATTRSFRKRLF